MQKALCLSIAALGAILGMISDWALLYDPLGRYLELPKYAFLTSLPVARIWLGHFLGPLAIPLELFALPLVLQASRATNREQKTAWIAMGGLVTFGVVFHMSMLPYRLWIDATSREEISWLMPMFQFLEIACGAGIAFLAFGWWKLAARFRYSWMRWFLNPALTYPLWVLFFVINPNLGGLILMQGMNLSVLVCIVGLGFELSSAS